MALVFVMVDGVGLAAPSDTNPVAAGFPRLSRLLGVPLAAGLDVRQPELLARAIDANLGVPGLPQSGSGHATIYGGFNAAARNGRHQPSYPTVAMRAALSEQNVFRAALDGGARVCWANAYLPGYEDAIARRRQRHTAGTWAVIEAGLPLNKVDDLMAGRALTWDIDQHLARTRPGATQLPLIDPGEAGARLARLARDYDLVAFETYLPDLSAHERIPVAVPRALELVDRLLAGALDRLAADDTLVVTSDHGNSEDSLTRTHTRNPVPLLAFGPAVPRFAAVRGIDEIAAALLSALVPEAG